MNLSKFLPLIGIVIFIAVLINMDIPVIVESLAGVNLYYLGLVLLLHIPIVLIKAGKWKVITHSYRETGGFIRFIHAFIVGYVIGIVTPGRIGEFTKVYYLKDRVSIGKGVAAVAIDRIIDIAVLFILAITGAILFLFSFAGIIQSEFLYMVILLFIAFVAFSLLVLTKKRFMERLARPLFNRFVPGRFRSGLRKAFDDFYKGLKEIRKRKGIVLVTIILTLAVWLIIIFQFKLMSIALGLEIDYFFLLSVVPIVVLLDSLPISFSGLGTRDVAMLFFLGIIGIAAESVVSFSVLIFLVSYLTFIPVGLILWLVKPIRIEV